MSHEATESNSDETEECDVPIWDYSGLQLGIARIYVCIGV